MTVNNTYKKREEETDLASHATYTIKKKKADSFAGLSELGKR